MSEKKEEKKEEQPTERNETRKFRYSHDDSAVSFEFEIDVSSPEQALAEIADFKTLIGQSLEDLILLSFEFANKIEKPVKKEEKPKAKKEDNGPVVKSATASK